MKKNILILTLMMITPLLKSTPLGFLKPFNFMIEPEPVVAMYNIKNSAKFQWGIMTQLSYDTNSFDEDGNLVNAMQIYETQQNVLGLYQGTGTSDKSSQFINSLAGGSGGGVNNSENGLFTPTGDFNGSQFAFFGTYMFHNHCFFKFALPVYKVQLSNVTWAYTGNNTTFAGQAIETELVNDFISDAKNLFGLNLSNWNEAGIGDLLMLLDYICDFPQGRTLLRNVRVHGRLGLTFPTGFVASDNVMSVPFGADGSMTLPFGGGLDINLGRYFQCGFRGEFSYIWGNEMLRRVPSFKQQTSLLFPQLVPTYKDYGITQLFNLYAQAYGIAKGLSFKVAYEYYNKGVDTISVDRSGFNYELLNTNKRLDEMTTHNMIFFLSFDSGFLEKRDKIHPQASIFLNLPFNGSFATLASSVGMQLSLDF